MDFLHIGQEGLVECSWVANPLAAEMLLEAVEGKGPLMFAEVAMRKAVNAGKSAPGKRRTTDASSTLSHSVSAADLKRAGPLDLDQAYRASDSPRGNAA